MDVATENRTRPSMAKVRVEVNLTKTQINFIFIGTENENCPHKGFYQKLEYENAPKFCTHCRMLGHSTIQCRRVGKKKEGNQMVAAEVQTRQNQDEKGETHLQKLNTEQIQQSNDVQDNITGENAPNTSTVAGTRTDQEDDGFIEVTRKRNKKILKTNKIQDGKDHTRATGKMVIQTKNDKSSNDTKEDHENAKQIKTTEQTRH
ncbi:uncharacterized protein LOC132631534 [Lycium barbarum]|uniref:uncharacterized protein LOC132631534 n=1 Tax=Lycium barbarum TaxID=112863 RepID=UPI00293E2C2B|nr:uncharacterized protein LOC132631534 [Lycium barbarum]